MIVPKQRKLSASYEKEKELCIKYFEQWSESDQVEFVEHLISQMCHYQHGHINSYLKPMLQRDFITALPGILLGAYKEMYSFLFGSVFSARSLNYFGLHCCLDLLTCQNIYAALDFFFDEPMTIVQLSFSYWHIHLYTYIINTYKHNKWC